MSKWTAEEAAFLAQKAVQRWSASRIADALGRTKNSVISRARKAGIRLNGERFYQATGEVGASRSRTPADKNVIKLVIPKHSKASPIAVAPMQTVEVERGPRLSVITNERRLIQDYIAKHGVRRFERGQSGDYEGVKRFLEDRGYSLNGWQGKHRVSRGAGRPKLMFWSQVIDLVDEIRTAEGLQTLRRQA
ncbi:MAG: hypothetical protein ACTHKQ_24740 [Mesorhizobium sp.]